MLALKNSGYNFISSDVAFKKNCGGPTSIEMHSENCSFIKTFPLLEKPSPCSFAFCNKSVTYIATNDHKKIYTFPSSTISNTF